MLSSHLKASLNDYFSFLKQQIEAPKISYIPSVVEKHSKEEVHEGSTEGSDLGFCTKPS